MHVAHKDVDVVITVPADLARDIAAVWAQAHAADSILSETRPDWHADVIALVSHAAMADQLAGAGPAAAEAVFLPLPSRTDRPRLEVVSQ